MFANNKSDTYYLGVFIKISTLCSKKFLSTTISKMVDTMKKVVL